MVAHIGILSSYLFLIFFFAARLYDFLVSGNEVFLFLFRCYDRLSLYLYYQSWVFSFGFMCFLDYLI